MFYVQLTYIKEQWKPTDLKSQKKKKKIRNSMYGIWLKTNILINMYYIL